MQGSAFEPFRPDKVDELIAELTPAVEAILARVDVAEFTTPDFIEALLSDPDAHRAYDAAIAAWGENEQSSKLVIHGQVIPGILRKSARVEWAGFAHGVADAYAVPAWWRVVDGRH